MESYHVQILDRQRSHPVRCTLKQSVQHQDDGVPIKLVLSLDVFLGQQFLIEDGWPPIIRID